MNSLAIRINDEYQMEELQHCHTTILADEIERDIEGGARALGVTAAGVNLHDCVPALVGADGYSWVLLSGSPAEICGVLCVEKGAFDTYEHNLAAWVKPSHRRNGLFVGATCKAVELLKDYGVNQIEIKVDKGNLPTLAAIDVLAQELDVDIVRDNAEYKQWVINLGG